MSQEFLLKSYPKQPRIDRFPGPAHAFADQFSDDLGPTISDQLDLFGHLWNNLFD
jgi:hypothetical protein